jgi:phosphoglycerate dehydrogenase-like enzyme
MANIIIFTSIEGIAQSFHDVYPDFPLQEVKDEALSSDGGIVRFDPSALRRESVAILKGAQILISEPAIVAKLLEHDASALSSLRWCQSTHAGVNPIFDSGIALPLSFDLTRFAGCFGPPIAEWCIARIVGHERNFAASAEDQMSKYWGGSMDAVRGYRYLSSLTLSVLGCGDIGTSVAKAARTFGMRTVGYGKRSRNADQKMNGIDTYTTNITEALRAADYIVSVLPSTPETRGLLNDDALLPASKRSGGKCPVFLNVGRGDVINEESLLNALDNRWISAAILDVFAVEPLPEGSALWSRSDVVVSPHVSGLTQGKDVPKVFMENYERFLKGEVLKYSVDWEKGY